MRLLLEDNSHDSGLPTWAWTTLCLAIGFTLGCIVALLCRCPSCLRRQTEVPSASPPANFTPVNAFVSATEPIGGTSEELHKYDSLSTNLAGPASSTSANQVDGSISASHWNGLATVSENDPAGAAVRRPRPSSTLNPSAVNLPTASITSLTSVGARPPREAPKANGGASGSHAHERTVSAVSTVSSVGPSAEYDEDDLDDEWLKLIQEVNDLLASKGKDPIKTAKERATVVNSLLVSTVTRERRDCVRNAAVDMLTYRKMHGLAM